MRIDIKADVGENEAARQIQREPYCERWTTARGAAGNRGPCGGRTPPSVRRRRRDMPVLARTGRHRYDNMRTWRTGRPSVRPLHSSSQRVRSAAAWLMSMTHVPETGTENPYQKLVPPVFWYQFFVPDETGSKIFGLIFLYYCPPN